MYVPTAEMNIGDSARLFADEGEYERRMSNRAVMSGEGKCFVKLKALRRRVTMNLTTVPRE